MVDEMGKQWAQQAGFVVGEDPDQPGLYQWTRQEAGRTVEGCESSFATETQAWNEAVAMTVDACLGEANLTPQDWQALPQKQKLAMIAQTFN